MDDRLAEALAELDEARLKADQVTQSLNAIKAGRSVDALIRTTQEKLLSMQDAVCELQVTLNNEIARLRVEQDVSVSSASVRTAAASASAAAIDAAEPPRKTQRTLANWFMQRSSEDALVYRKLDGPLVIASTLHPCPECGAEKKNLNGLREHMRHCAAVQIAQERQSEKQRRLAAARVQAAPAESEEDVESDAESHKGGAPVQAVPAPGITGVASTVKVKSNRGGQSVRKSFSYVFKLRVVEFVRAWMSEHPGKKGGQKRAAEIFGLADCMVSHWINAGDKIVAGARKMLGARGRGNIGRLVQRSPRGAQPRYAAAEALVFGKFLAARKKNKAISGQTLKVWMRKAVKDVYVGDLRAAEFKASAGWLTKFKARNNIVTRRRTNKKVVAIEARLPAVQKFHRDLRAFVSEPGGAAHEVYGRFAPDAIFNVDQSPILLQPGSASTLEVRGTARVQIATRDAGDKRYCTLQLTVSPGARQVKVMLIFRGQGKRISAQERAAWDPRVHVEFQPNAWVDGDMVETYVKRVFKPFLEEQGVGEALLFMDNLAAQQTEDVRAMYTANGIVPFFFPPNVTDLLQPVDHHLAQQFKRRMADLLDERLLEDEAFANKWLGIEDGTMPAWEVRVQLTRLAGEAWEHVCTHRDFVKLFQETGCLMPKVGACMDGVAPIKIEGVTNYAFELAPGQVTASAPAPAPPPPPPPPPPLDDEPLISEDEGEEAEAAHAANSTAVEAEAADSSGSSASLTPMPAGQDAAASANDDEAGDDRLQLDVDVDADRDELADETADESAWGVGVPEAPPGFVIAAKPTDMPSFRSLLNTKVLWAIPVTASGAPGWIVSSVCGGPLTPSSALMGVTMRLKCTKRMDKATPADLLVEAVEVAFNLDNYGTRWCMLL